MKEEINLLPPVAQATRRSNLYQKRARGLYVSLVVTLLVLGLSYAVSYTVLLMLGPSAEEMATVETETGIVKQIREANVFVGIVHRTLKEHPAWVIQIAEVLRAVPPGVIVTGIQVSTVDQAIEISGSSSNRDRVVLLENRLKELSWVANVDAPLQNFASSPSVGFRFSITRDL